MEVRYSAKLEYWQREYNKTYSKVVKEIEIFGVSEIDLFEQFYKLNNQLRYCNGSYYTFKDFIVKIYYDRWLESDDYKSKSFNLYYGNGIVD